MTIANLDFSSLKKGDDIALGISISYPKGVFSQDLRHHWWEITVNVGLIWWQLGFEVVGNKRSRDLL